MEILGRGGSAIDAAIAVDAVLGVVAPETCGIGGDLFALVHRPGDLRPTVLNASGRAGSNAHADELRRAGATTIPDFHPLTVTIPGCVDGWAELNSRFGRLSLTDVLAPAIRHAAEGFPVSRELAASLVSRRNELLGQASASALYPHDNPPDAGDRIRRPDLAATLADLARHGPAAFYEGAPGQAISEAVGGRIDRADLAEPQAEWVAPVGIDLFGLTGWTAPPNSQGYLTLAAAYVFQTLSPPRDVEHADFVHAQIEAYRSVAFERDDLVGDFRFLPLPIDELLSPARLTARTEMVSMSRAGQFPVPAPAPGGTAFMCVLDDSGMGVSLIQSNYMGIGSGIGAGSCGFFLHNRGAGFNLVPGHCNELAPGRRPFHTLSPSLWTQDGRLELLLGTRGGGVQPQLLVQMATRLLWAGQPAVQAQDGARWTMEEFGPSTTSIIDIEGAAGPGLVTDLERRGHRVTVIKDRQPGWGPVAVIRVGPEVIAAADPRVDTASAEVS